MSANKKFEFDTKITEDENGDSGFLSGPLDVLPDDPEPEQELLSEDKKVLCVSEILPSRANEYEQEESGIVCLSERMSDVQLGENISTKTPLITVSEQKKIPPFVIFFQPDAEGDTQLHIASVHGCEKSVGTLIRICPNKALMDVANDDGHTPLHLAVMTGNAVVTRMLVHAGLSLGVRDRIGETPLHKATSKGYVECLQALLAPVPENPSRHRLSSILEEKNYNGQACVHIAASTGNLEVLQTLVYYGANINARENLAGWTALHIAARRGDSRLTQYLVERCAGVELQTRDFANRSARRLAARSPAAACFLALAADTDSDYDSDDDMYDSDNESLFERLRDSMTANNVNLKSCC